MKGNTKNTPRIPIESTYLKMVNEKINAKRPK